MPTPKQENLVPVGENPTPEVPVVPQTPAPEPAPVVKPEPAVTPAPEPTPEPKEIETSFFKGDSMTNAARDDMFKLTGENPESEIVPITPESELEPEPENVVPSNQPDPANPQNPQDPANPQQPQSGEIIAAGKKFTPDQLSKSYTDLNKEFHKRNNDHGNEVRGLQLKLAEVVNQNEQRRILIESAVLKNGQNGNNGNSPNSPINQENFDKMVEDGKTVEAIGQIVQASMQDVQKTQATSLEKERKDAEVVATKERQVENLQTMGRELKSFEENRDKFAKWAEDQLGNSEVGLAAISGIASDMPRLKKFYGNYLKSTYDFSQKISEATHKGQTMAQVKQSLQPVSSGGDASPSNLVTTKPVLQSVDKDLLEMEGHLGTAQMRPSFFGKR